MFLASNKCFSHPTSQFTLPYISIFVHVEGEAKEVPLAICGLRCSIKVHFLFLSIFYLLQNNTRILSLKHD
jgi:hypothetical protein